MSGASSSLNPPLHTERCVAGAGDLTLVRLATHAMATRFEFALYSENEHNLRAAGEEAIAEIEYLHEKFSYFSPSSIVSRINRLAAHEPVALDRETFDLFMLCRDVWHASGGAFDITIAPLMRSWGLRNGPPAAPPDGDIPFGFQFIHLDRHALTIQFSIPNLEIDLGGVAKGYALDRAAAIVREAGIDTALIHGGTSSVTAIGSPPDAAGWSIRIQDERQPHGVTLRDAALSVSALRGRTGTRGGQAQGHIVDPRTGVPACGDASTAAVIADHAAVADAWSTALLVLGQRPPSMDDSYATMIRNKNDGWRCSESLPSQFATHYYSTCTRT